MKSRKVEECQCREVQRRVDEGDELLLEGVGHEVALGGRGDVLPGAEQLGHQAHVLRPPQHNQHTLDVPVRIKDYIKFGCHPPTASLIIPRIKLNWASHALLIIVRTTG